MTAPNAGCSSWGPDTQQLSLQVNITPSTTCANIRYMFTGCLHILLLRCPIHPVSQATATFSAVEAQGSCPLCAEQAETRMKMITLEAHITRLQADIKAHRANRGGSRNGVSASAMIGEIAKAELQRAKESLRALTRSFESCGGGTGMDLLGLRATYEPGKFNQVAGSCSWSGCDEENKLWGWGLDA